MAKQNKAAAKKPGNLGKGKVTPVQIAFIVDRYLADNNFTATLSAFRSDASHLFSKAKGKEVPKGLLGLGEILDEYITLKEQRVVVDQEKRRVEMALQGMQEVMRAYHSGGTAPLLPPSPPLLPPEFVAPPSPRLTILPALYPGSGSPQEHAVNGTSMMNYVQQSPIIHPHKSPQANYFSTPAPKSSSTNKKRTFNSAPNGLSAQKKPRTQSPSKTSMSKDVMLLSQEAQSTKSQDKENSTVMTKSISVPTVQSSCLGSSVAKSLFKQAVDCQVNSVPKTPPHPLPSQVEISTSSLENRSLQTNDSSTSKEIGSSNCSIIASETIIISPLKHTGFYAVERSYHITSPYKPKSSKCKRENIRGKLDFDKPDPPTTLEQPAATVCSTSSTEEEISERFDFDLPDLDVFTGDFSFAELIADMDLDCHGNPSSRTLPSSALASSIPGWEDHDGNLFLDRTQVLPDSSLSSNVMEVLPEGMNLNGPDSVTSVKTITKHVKILSPVKIRSSMEQSNSPTKNN